MPNQDAIAWLPSVGHGSSVALSVADGHGSARSFRSADGSRLANQVAMSLAGELLEIDIAAASPGMLRGRLTEDLPRRLVRDWRKAVDDDLAANPFTDVELDGVRTREGSVDALNLDPYVAYGTTLVTAVATTEFLASWQVGDGDLVSVSADGKVSRPIPSDDRLIANETTSLCSKDAWSLFRVALLREHMPLVLLSTDGLVNSFVDDTGMLRFATDIASLIQQDGFDEVVSRVPGWLEELTASGSGDDISLGLLWSPAPPVTRQSAEEAEARSL